MSDIFNEFAKIAIEKGLITEAAEVGDETNPRFDSLSNDDIKSLYGIKPNGEEKHILDQAHPESVVVSPAYDKMNGLVENLFERQDIMAWIATKPNDGKHTQERYVKASKDLTMALLNTAMMLDRTGDEELMKLADSCAERMAIKKMAIAVPLIIGGIVLGLGAAWKYTSEYRQETNVPEKIDRVLEEMKEISTTKWYRANDETFPQIYKELKFLRRALTVFKRSAQRIRKINIGFDPSGVKSKTDMTENIEDIKAAAHKAYKDKSFEAIKHYAKMIDFMLDIIPGAMDTLNLRDKQIGYGRGMGRLGPLFRWFEPGDLKDIVLELEALQKIIEAERPLLESQMEIIGNIPEREDALAALEQASGKVETSLDKKTPSKVELLPKKTTPEKPVQLVQFEKPDASKHAARQPMTLKV